MVRPYRSVNRRQIAVGHTYGRMTVVSSAGRNRHYSPDNCVWADRKTQSRNKRNVPLYEFDGSKKSLAEWSELSGVHVNTLRKRLSKGWTLQRAMSQPVRPIKGVHY